MSRRKAKGTPSNCQRKIPSTKLKYKFQCLGCGHASDNDTLICTECRKLTADKSQHVSNFIELQGFWPTSMLNQLKAPEQKTGDVTEVVDGDTIYTLRNGFLVATRNK